MVNIDYSEAATEVLEILNNTNKEDVEQIPKKFIEFLKEVSSKTYKPDICYFKPIEEMNLKKRTIDILSMICINYWCDNMSKIEFINKLEYNEKIQQEKLNEKYNINDILKNRREINKNQALVPLDNKESVITKIIDKIRNKLTNIK